jgi:hypothetical protein
MVDPATSRFYASWQDEDGSEAMIEDIELDGAEAAIGWGLARSEFVFIRLGNRGDTYFCAGVEPDYPEEDEEPMAMWPPTGPPDGGWWVPPVIPTLDEARGVAADVEAGRRTAQDAAGWAYDRLFLVLDSVDDPNGDPLVAEMVKLTRDWVQIGDEVRRGSFPATAIIVESD